MCIVRSLRFLSCPYVGSRRRHLNDSRPVRGNRSHLSAENPDVRRRDEQIAADQYGPRSPASVHLASVHDGSRQLIFALASAGHLPIPAPMTTTPISTMRTPVTAAPWALIQSRATTSRGSIQLGKKTVARIGATTVEVAIAV